MTVARTIENVLIVHGTCERSQKKVSSPYVLYKEQKRKTFRCREQINYSALRYIDNIGSLNGMSLLFRSIAQATAYHLQCLYYSATIQ